MLNNKKILITGGTGSWGNELTKQILEKYNPSEIRIYSRGEHRQVQMKIKFSKYKNIKYFIGDVRDKDRLSLVTKGVDYIFHLAALKHVPICELNPWEAVLTNVIGTRNVVECAIENNVKKVIDISTDKAVDPFNLYGVSKSCGEKLMIAANAEVNNGTSFVCIRGGNVIGTNGSVIPLFKDQILKNNEITITDERMSRFFLSLKEAVNLIFKATKDSIGGEIFVMKMPSAKITDLAEVMIDTLGNQKTNIRTIGIRPGEKLYEVLVSKYEVSNCVESGDYYIILPQIKIPLVGDYYKNFKKMELEEFNSKNTRILEKKEIKKILESDGWFLDKKKSEGDYYGHNLSGVELKEIFRKEGWQKE